MINHLISAIQPVKDRQIIATKPVKVYFNLHKKCFSILQNGLVVGHTDSIALRDVTFKVSQAGRNRVLKERRKNVHAFVTGYLDCFADERFYDVKIVYNPYKYDSFRLYHKDSITVHNIGAVLLRSKDGRSQILADRDAHTDGLCRIIKDKS